MNNKKAVVSWSGGKDSCFAAIKALEQGFMPTVLLNVLNEDGVVSRAHGIPKNILQAQAEALQIPLYTIAASWQEYEKKFTGALGYLKSSYHLSHAIFGDIDLQAHRDWEEKVCASAGLEAVLPLWLQDRKKLVLEMLQRGLQTIIVSCNNMMGERFLGKLLTTELVEELEHLNIDPCGENGEFHTLVTDCQLFKKPIPVSITQKIKHDDYWFAQLTSAP